MNRQFIRLSRWDVEIVVAEKLHPSNFENAVNDRKCGIFTVKLDLESGRRCVATESKSEVWYSVVPCSELFFCCLLARGESFPLPRGRENPESGVETKRLLTLLLLPPPRLATSCVLFLFVYINCIFEITSKITRVSYLFISSRKILAMRAQRFKNS